LSKNVSAFENYFRSLTLYNFHFVLQLKWKFTGYIYVVNCAIVLDYSLYDWILHCCTG